MTICRLCGSTKPGQRRRPRGDTALRASSSPSGQLEGARGHLPAAPAGLHPAAGWTQIPPLITPEETFTEYAYFSSYSDVAGSQHAREFVGGSGGTGSGWGSDSFVVEIASNDGDPLQHFVQRGSGPGHRAVGERRPGGRAKNAGVPTLTRSSSARRPAPFGARRARTEPT